MHPCLDVQADDDINEIKVIKIVKPRRNIESSILLEAVTAPPNAQVKFENAPVNQFIRQHKQPLVSVNVAL